MELHTSIFRVTACFYIQPKRDQHMGGSLHPHETQTETPTGQEMLEVNFRGGAAGVLVAQNGPCFGRKGETKGR